MPLALGSTTQLREDRLLGGLPSGAGTPQRTLARTTYRKHRREHPALAPCQQDCGTLLYSVQARHRYDGPEECVCVILQRVGAQAGY